MTEELLDERVAAECSPSQPALPIGSDPCDFQLVLNGVLDYAIFLLDTEGMVRTWNLGAERIKGYRADEIIGRHFSTFYPQADKDSGYPQQELKWAASRGRYEEEGWRIRKDGSSFWANVVITAFHDANGKLRGFSKVTRDLSNRTTAEEAVATSEAKLSRIFQSDFIGIFFWNVEGYITEANNAFLQLVGYTPEDIQQGHVRWDHMTPPQYRDADMHAVEELQTKGFCTTLDKEYVRKDNTRIPVLVGASAFTPDGSQGVAFVVDNSERKSHEMDLDKSRQILEERVAERTMELETLTCELREAKEAADTANLAKSEFLSRMSHELRTPLNAISGFAQVLGMQGLTPNQEASVDYILKGSSHLLRLINEVLDIARVETGKMELSLEPVAVAVVIREAMDLVQPLAQQLGVTMITESDDSSDIHVLADQHRLKQVLINLLSNAIKYNRSGGNVFVPFEDSNGKIHIAVSDTGRGLKPESLEKLFTPFESLEAANSQIEGTGLGLALSRRMVEAMGGTITVRSEVGIGSTFYIELNTAQSLQNPLLQELRIEAQQPLLNGKTYCVLAIEDNPANFALLRSILEYRPGIELQSALLGRMGLDFAELHCPDLILLDLHLPDMPGIEVLQELRRTPATANIPIVVISADATARQMNRLMEAGANTYLRKPLDVKEFLSTVDSILEISYVADSPDGSADKAN